MRIKNLKVLIISILIPIIVGLLSAFFTGESMAQYNYFTKPSLSPPAIIFPIVWTVLKQVTVMLCLYMLYNYYLIFSGVLYFLIILIIYLPLYGLL